MNGCASIASRPQPGTQCTETKSAGCCHHKPASHKRHGRDEESHFRRRQCPVVTHVAPRLLDDSTHQRALPNIKKWLKVGESQRVLEGFQLFSNIVGNPYFYRARARGDSLFPVQPTSQPLTYF